jgi:hypothetical protein
MMSRTDFCGQIWGGACADADAASAAASARAAAALVANWVSTRAVFIALVR